MFVSLHLSPQSRGADDDAEIVERTISQAVRAERHGVAAVCLTEHHLGGFNTYTDPFMLGSFLAARLTSAHVAITVAQVAQHHPVRLVERCNVLDVLTRGRCLVALGQGWASRVETEAFGIDALDGAAVTEERIDAMLRIWRWDGADGPLDASTSVDRATLHARVSPAPFRRPRPLVGRASTSPATIRAAGERGMPAVFGTWDPAVGAAHLDLYRDALERADVDEDTRRACLDWAVYTVPVVVGRTQRDAEARLERYRRLAASGPCPAAGADGAFWEAEWTARELGKASIAVVGSPERIAEHVGQSVAAGARGVRLLPVQASGAHGDADEHLSILLEDLLPRLRPERLSELSTSIP